MSYFVDTLFRTTIAIPVETYSYALHLEVLNTLLSLLSIQMCAKEAALISAIYSIFMHRLEYENLGFLFLLKTSFILVHY